MYAVPYISTRQMKAAGPWSQMSVKREADGEGWCEGVKVTERSEMRAWTVIWQDSRLSQRVDGRAANLVASHVAREEATIPVPHASVSSSTPFSNVRTVISWPGTLTWTKFTLTP